MTKPQVVIVVDGGAAEVTAIPEGIEVRIIDEDTGHTDIFSAVGILKERIPHYAS